MHLLQEVYLRIYGPGQATNETDRKEDSSGLLTVAAFQTLKEAPCTAPLLGYPRPGERFIVDTDASNVGIGGVLSQVQYGGERVIAYFSKPLSKAERNYCITRRELLAIVKTLEHFHKYLYGQEFHLRIDHSAFYMAAEL